MSTYSVAVAADISAPADACYGVIADYKEGHPAIVPPKYFGPLVVEAGGVGHGTRIRFTMRVLGQDRELRAVITEPVPGRVLVEDYPDANSVTRFTVAGVREGVSRVTIETQFPRGRGFRAALERMLVQRAIPPIYIEELGRLANHVGGSVVGRPVIERSG